MIYDHESKVIGARPCPFCGGTNLKAENRDFFEEVKKKHGFDLGSIAIECETCGAHLRGDAFETYDEALVAATNQWNRRAQ